MFVFMVVSSDVGQNQEARGGGGETDNRVATVALVSTSWLLEIQKSATNCQSQISDYSVNLIEIFRGRCGAASKLTEVSVLRCRFRSNENIIFYFIKFNLPNLHYYANCNSYCRLPIPSIPSSSSQ